MIDSSSPWTFRGVFPESGTDSDAQTDVLEPPKLVRRLIRELGLVACQPRPYQATTIPDQQPAPIPDLVARDFTAAAPGTKLVGDITYIATLQGWVDQATVIDCFNREVVGYAMAGHLRTSVVIDQRRLPDPA